MSDSEPDGMLAYWLALDKCDRNDPNWPLPSFDARDWAQKFCELARDDPMMAENEEIMVVWFANALMRGYDEAVRRARKGEAP